MDETERLKKAFERRVLEQELDLRNVMSSRSGRRFVWRILDELAGAMNPSFAGENSHQSAYAEGRRAVGLELFAELQRVDADGFVQMMGEELAARREEAANRLRDEPKDTDT